MHADFPHLFSPLRVGSMELKNRVVVAPHGTNMAKDGVLTKEYVSYEIERASGGASLLIMSYGHTMPMDTNNVLIDTWRRENIDGFREVVERAHKHECRVLFQFGDNARRTRLAPTAVTFPSVPTFFGGVSAVEMSHDDIELMQQHYVHHALLLQEAGLDGIELHGHGDIFSDFLSPAINRRGDEYGGSLTNRMRYLVETVERIREAVGPEMVMGHRLSPCDGLPHSLVLEEGIEIAARLAAGGTLDYLSISHAVEPQLLDELIPPLYVQPGFLLSDAFAVRAAVNGLPIMVAGRITTPAEAESALDSGSTDLVAMARAFIADPEWANKARVGRPEEIRPCLGDNQDCIGRVGMRLPIRCTVNPVVGRESEWGLGRRSQADHAKSVAVVGGGPAGMEAAWVAAERGHRVTLYERDDQLGGQVLMAQQLPGRHGIGAILRWQEHQLNRHGVQVVLGCEASADLANSLGSDVLIYATGAMWPKSGFNGTDFFKVSGWEQSHVYGLQEALLHAGELSGRIAIFDVRGFVQGVGVAELLSSAGNEVHLITPFPVVGGAALDETLQRRHIARRLGSVSVHLETRVNAIAGATVSLENIAVGTSATIEGVDAMVIVGWPVAAGLGADASVSLLSAPHRIGDCLSPGTIGDAIRGGHEVGMMI